MAEKMVTVLVLKDGTSHNGTIYNRGDPVDIEESLVRPWTDMGFGTTDLDTDFGEAVPTEAALSTEAAFNPEVRAAELEKISDKDLVQLARDLKLDVESFNSRKEAIARIVAAETPQA